VKLWRRGLAAVAVSLVPLGALAQPVPISATSVPLDPGDPAHDRVGMLVYMGGLELRSPNSSFGGLSGLELLDDGERIVAVTDEGRWLTARLLRDAHGRLVGLDEAEMGALRDLSGLPLPDKSWGDAESLARLPDGRLVVSFERHHRMWAYPAGPRGLSARPEALDSPPGLSGAPENGGLEALAVLADGNLVALTEEQPAGDGVRGWWGRPGTWRPLELPVDGMPRPSGATRLPSGDLLLLERGFSLATGSVIRLVRLSADQVRAGGPLTPDVVAELARPLTVDNFEGITATRDAAGRTIVLLLSDDNFSPAQRTLLLLFALEGEPAGPRARVRR